ncbi:biotin carboxylase [Micromonospora sp. M71_S20]|uniref:ATP-grasp domain-containing protein n=1 Tax=Micromonospora sp. M71_S20 TaxID=592872 RepID=UPI000F20D690|nr:ATP-grasp domain-containing protein [Micromonospora sp. M71_S20]RLK24653.1 biotin carboxylase [Micromonospora sp. M71_S20]
MPTIAIVDGYSAGSALSRALAERGVTCVHVRSAESLYDYYLKTFRPGDYAVDLGFVADEDSLVERLRALGTERVVAGTETGVVLADTLNHLLGTPGNDIATVTARRDKSAMAATVAATGLAVPAGRCFESVDEAVAWYADSLSGPAVVKPVDGAGTDNVRFCGSVDEVRLACATVLAASNLYGVPNRRVLVQERLVGTEFYVNTVSYAGTHRVAEIWRYTKRPGPGGGPIYDYEEPVDRGSALARQLREFVFGVLDALGIRSSAAHTELMLTDRGPVLIETGARLGGATLPDVVAKFCGVSQTFLQAQHLVDPASLDRFDDRTPGWAAVRNVSLINPAPVAAQAEDWCSRLSELPAVVAVAASCSPGAELPQTVDLFSSPGYLYLAAEDPTEVERDYQTLRRWEQHGLYGS